MIVKELDKLKEICEPVSSVEEGEEIGVKLLEELSNSKNGIGLAANQIGINKRVCVVNVTEPLVLINPEILNLDNRYIYTVEGCLSFPNRQIRTKRSKWVTIKTDNLGTVMFGPNELMGNKDKDELQLLESVCIQHEIDHLDGITMFDRMYKQQPITTGKKYGRNEKVEITNGKETKTLKWKKAEALVDSGEWEVEVGV
tara:strand:+ start:581 stop:1177 length:597 start_codon:yes stop_codon:yes gene_type:complete